MFELAEISVFDTVVRPAEVSTRFVPFGALPDKSQKHVHALRDVFNARHNAPWQQIFRTPLLSLARAGTLGCTEGAAIPSAPIVSQVAARAWAELADLLAEEAQEPGGLVDRQRVALLGYLEPIPKPSVDRR